MKQEPTQLWQFGLPAPPADREERVAAISLHFSVSPTNKEWSVLGSPPIPTTSSAVSVHVVVEIVVGWVEEVASEDAVPPAPTKHPPNISSKTCPSIRGLFWSVDASPKVRVQKSPQQGLRQGSECTLPQDVTRTRPTRHRRRGHLRTVRVHVKQVQEHDEKRTHGGGKGSKLCCDTTFEETACVAVRAGTRGALCVYVPYVLSASLE